MQTSFSPLVYTKELCSLSLSDYIVSMCFAVIYFLFGSNLLPLIIALAMLMLDTITGVYAANIEEKRGKNKISSSAGWAIIPKATAILTVFLVANWLSFFYQSAVGEGIKYGLASIVITVEALSILENAKRIDPRYSFKTIRKALNQKR